MANNKDEIYYRIALTFVQGVGSKTSRILIQHFGSAQNALKASQKELMSMPGMGVVKAKACKDKNIYRLAESELDYAEMNGVKLLCRGDKAYPDRLSDCSDAPEILYYIGDAELDATKVVAVVGTRSNTDYGSRICNELIEELSSDKDVLIVSGLAKGIDAIAHKASLKYQLPTIGVMAHGLNMVYPRSNKSLALTMVENGGGLLTEFGSGVKLDRGNFPARNRIVAGLADVVVVVESDVKGGALITAEIAQSYNRDVAAFPGRAYDKKSAGANVLIRNNVAALIDNADDLRYLMNWQKKSSDKKVPSVDLNHLTNEEQVLLSLMCGSAVIHADVIKKDAAIESSVLAATLLELEFKGLISVLPGNYYQVK